MNHEGGNPPPSSFPVNLANENPTIHPPPQAPSPSRFQFHSRYQTLNETLEDRRWSSLVVVGFSHCRWIALAVATIEPSRRKTYVVVPQRRRHKRVTAGTKNVQ
ncbi:hypothetical protein LXL04_028629 [Taraxacum kok-saghyz]